MMKSTVDSPVDPALDARLRRTLTLVAATVVDGAAPARAPVRPARRRRPVPVTGRRLALVAGAAALLTVAGLVGQGGWLGGRPDTANAAEVLHGAARAAAREPALAARPDQFVFVESIVTMATPAGGPEQKHGQQWRSVDGGRAGLVRFWRESDPAHVQETPWPPPPRPGAPPPYRGPAYPRDLPTDPGQMLRYLYAHPPDLGLPAGVPAEPDLDAWVTAATLLTGYVPPDARSALYEAMARIPGTSVVPDAVDAAGRRGVAVRMPDHAVVPGGWFEVIFDRTTYAFLGTLDTTGVLVDGQPRTTQMLSTAVLRIAIVDRAGQLP